MKREKLTKPLIQVHISCAASNHNFIYHFAYFSLHSIFWIFHFVHKQFAAKEKRKTREKHAQWEKFRFSSWHAFLSFLERFYYECNWFTIEWKSVTETLVIFQQWNIEIEHTIRSMAKLLFDILHSRLHCIPFQYSCTLAKGHFSQRKVNGYVFGALKAFYGYFSQFQRLNILSRNSNLLLVEWFVEQNRNIWKIPFLDNPLIFSMHTTCALPFFWCSASNLLLCSFFAQHFQCSVNVLLFMVEFCATKIRLGTKNEYTYWFSWQEALRIFPWT